MKRTIIDIVKILVACIVAIVVTMGVDALGIGYRYGHVAVFFCAAIAMLALLGVFDSADKSASEEGRVKSEEFLCEQSEQVRAATAAKKNYGQAAVFIGTACLFIGSPKECDAIADDLQHYAVQAEVSDVTDDFEIL